MRANYSGARFRIMPHRKRQRLRFNLADADSARHNPAGGIIPVKADNGMTGTMFATGVHPLAGADISRGSVFGPNGNAEQRWFPSPANPVNGVDPETRMAFELA